MLQNPQIKYDGQPNKGYLFPKYQGKFFVQSEKKKAQKSSQYLSLTKPLKPLIHYDFPKQDSKDMRGQAQYMNKIQQLKKKLQKQISRYNKVKDKNFNINKHMNLSLESKLQKQKQTRIIPDNSQIDKLEERQQNGLSELRKLRMKYAFRIPLKNNSQMRKKVHTQMEQSSLQSYRRNMESQFLTNRSSNSMLSRQGNHLPVLVKRELGPQSRQGTSISTAIRYSLPCSIFKSKTKKIIQPANQMGLQSFKIKQIQVPTNKDQFNKPQQYTLMNQELKMKSMGLASRTKKNQTKTIRKHIQPKQTYLNGWDSPHDKQTDLP